MWATWNKENGTVWTEPHRQTYRKFKDREMQANQISLFKGHGRGQLGRFFAEAMCTYLICYLETYFYCACFKRGGRRSG